MLFGSLHESNAVVCMPCYKPHSRFIAMFSLLLHDGGPGFSFNENIYLFKTVPTMAYLCFL